ncbi:hypothetical protein HH310_36370 [Actinoplanes sp. TBRC 11911]|uniref:hypothetical protein n=1 Tax=Actinoplanes sp. TBRC 11911 TaxID=2729386 RepID=UPI00145FBC1A|nr:hypothetical protein [Actinoplanes sp. TBRC 11911]NMO56636.1 hypothetical protein [Actinoplanes sp. TBRC 11911]
MTYLDETLAAALDLARAGRWQRALSLLDAADAAHANDATDDDRAKIARTAAEVALQSDLFAATALAGDRVSIAEQRAGRCWDVDFLRLRHDYFDQLAGGGAPRFGPDGKDATILAQLRRRATDLSDDAPDPTRHGWARMYLGLILDNLLAERDAAPEHYEAALRAGEQGDDLLTREALRHLGDHDRDNGALTSAGERWKRATHLGAKNGLVPGTLSQQMLLALLYRDLGDEPAATRLAEEIARWTDAIGAKRLHAQATAFRDGS